MLNNANITVTDNVIDLDTLATVSGGVAPSPERSGGCIPGGPCFPRPNPFPGPTFPRPPFPGPLGNPLGGDNV